MRRRQKQTPEQPPVDRGWIRDLLEQAAELHNCGRLDHKSHLLQELQDLAGGVAAYAFVCFPSDHKVTAADLDALESSLVRAPAPKA